MQKKQLPPVSMVKEDISEFYAITTDIFHVHHLYVTQKVNSKKKVVGFLSFKTQPNLIAGIEAFESLIERESLIYKNGSNMGQVEESSAINHPLPDDSTDLFFTDPPYYNAVPYADLSDFFYVWLKRTLANL